MSDLKSPAPSTNVIETDDSTVEVAITGGVSFCIAGTNIAAFKAEFDMPLNKYLI